MPAIMPAIWIAAAMLGMQGIGEGFTSFRRHGERKLHKAQLEAQRKMSEYQILAGKRTERERDALLRQAMEQAERERKGERIDRLLMSMGQGQQRSQENIMNILAAGRR